LAATFSPKTQNGCAQVLWLHR